MMRIDDTTSRGVSTRNAGTHPAPGASLSRLGAGAFGAALGLVVGLVTWAELSDASPFSIGSALTIVAIPIPIGFALGFLFGERPLAAIVRFLADD